MGDGIVPWTRHYAKRFFDVQLDRGFLSASAAADDEGFFDIDDFDTTHADYITWKQLSDGNGGLAIRRMFPQQTDTTLMSFFAWQLKFNDYARIDTVESVLKAMPSCRNASYAWQMAVLHGIPSDPGMKPKSKGADIANPGARLTNDGTTYSQQELGWQASHYEIDIPMAWEITKGTANVVVAVSDGFKQATRHQEHQDLRLSTNTTSPGNFVYTQSAGAGPVYPNPTTGMVTLPTSYDGPMAWSLWSTTASRIDGGQGMDAGGRLVITLPQSLPAGRYMVSVHPENRPSAIRSYTIVMN